MTSTYRYSPAVAARTLGVLLVGGGVLLVGGALLGRVVDLPGAVLPLLALVVLVAVVAGLLYSRVGLVRLDETGYRVDHLPRAGVRRARWADVEDVVASHAAGERVLVIRLGDGGSTTIPVRLLAGSADDFARDVRSRLVNRPRGR